jgi:FkbM family methyltransferase
MGMQNKKLVSLFTGAYSLVRPDKLMEFGAFRRAFVSAYFIYKKLFEDPFWNLVRRQPGLFQNGDILDIGANIGYTASVFAGARSPDSNVYAFEPDRQTFKLLGEVIRRKKLSGVIEAINMAVGSSEGQIRFWHNQKHSADHRVVTENFRSACTDETNISTVHITTVDSFVKTRNLQNISFIKIDVQGYELAVCEGMKETLDRFPETCVCLEHSPDALKELGFEPGRIIDFFRSREYQLYILTRAAPQLAPDDESLERALREAGYLDLLCSKRALL